MLPGIPAPTCLSATPPCYDGGQRLKAMPFSNITPSIRPTDGRWKDFIIEDEVKYTDRKTGKTVTIPVGFVTDFTSIPKLVRWRLDVMGKHACAALIHDWFYRCGNWDDGTEVDRGEADRVLRDSADDLGVGWRDRWLLYSGVRAGGWASWRDKCSPFSGRNGRENETR
jgi:hypothetical protein